MNEVCKVVDPELKQKWEQAVTSEKWGERKWARFFPGASEKNSKQIVVSEILNSPCLMVFERIDSVTLGFVLFCVVSVSLFLAERCNFIAVSGYCHDMLSVVCNASVLWQDDWS